MLAAAARRGPAGRTRADPIELDDFFADLDTAVAAGLGFEFLPRILGGGLVSALFAGTGEGESGFEETRGPRSSLPGRLSSRSK